ncbi:MAG: alpha-L-rhamnosidase C-terminal domain-containing protein [Terracidiphilus sp.]
MSAATLATSQIPGMPAHDSVEDWGAQWIWYPGQLAAYRHSRRIRLAMERCTNVGYPGNFRQPKTEAYFRKTGVASQDIPLRWVAPISRVRTTIGGRARDITARSDVLRRGDSGIEVQIDFAQSLPCLLMEGGAFSTGPAWEASLDGEHWVHVETGGGNNPNVLPDAPREVTVSLSVDRVIEPAGSPQAAYVVAAGRDALLDFHETELGSLCFTVRGKGQMTVQVGESIAEVRDPDQRYFEQYPFAPIPMTDASQHFQLPQRALRFARFSTLGEAELRGVRFDASLWPAEERGRFESSDPELNEIWKVAVSTLRSNMHDFYLDGIRRDGLLWHDGPLALDAYERVFFDADLSRQTLIGETLPEHATIHDVGIIDAPMYDVIGFEREYLARGDAGFSRMFRDRIEDIVQFYELLQNDRGFVDAARVEPYGFFPDWSATEQSGPDGHGTPAYGQMLLAAMFSAAGRLAAAWKDEDLQDRWCSAARKLVAAVREAFWRPSDGLYANGLDRDGKLDERFTSFAQAFAVAFGTARPEEYSSLFRFLDDEMRRPAHYSLSQVVELMAYARAGRAEQAVKRLKSAWLPMIKRGYWRFFEDIEPVKDANEQFAMYGRRYGASLCHVWAGAAPVMAVSRGILGIEPIEPGYKVCSVNPQRCGLEWVRGAVPVPNGAIEVEWQGDKGELRLPDGVVARCRNGSTSRGPGRFDLELDKAGKDRDGTN